MKKYLALYCVLFSNLMIAQYNMQDLTVYDCEGTLKDSESNALNPSWYSHDENFNFTIYTLHDSSVYCLAPAIAKRIIIKYI